uniref:NADH-ubiquinone oxidoreductase chain 3 n=1 Tax=Pseudosuccinea columella TaxID=31228 RepID=A0A4P8Y1S1_PSECM|nr:NADH dehydrogenase subunit 3 [Pseudosuccinea columella]QCT09601.1 NADH dehydrogenase subunit 3 [Pseudosuccinea columella]
MMITMILFNFIIAFALSTMLLIIFILTNFPIEGENEKLTPFECGFEPLSNMRAPFSIRFFVLVVLFLIFDVEISLLFPLVSLFSFSTFLMALSLMSFLFILLAGIFYEWKEGALDWVS